jgi:uncharacterized membrane protein
MKLKPLFVLICAGLLLGSKTARAGETSNSDPLAERLFPPDLILFNGDAIGLSDQQRQGIQSRVGKAQTRFQELQEALLKEQNAMAALLDRENLDEAALMKQLDRLLGREKDIKREQLELMLSLRNLLTPEQQARLKGLRKTYSPSAMEARLKEKVARVEAGLQKLANGGRDPSSIMEKMQPFPELMRAGKVKEAEELLDRVLGEVEAK